MRAAAFKLTLLGAVLVLTGCSSLNPFSKKVEARNAPAPLVELKPAMSVRAAWTTTIGKAGTHTFSPAFANDSLFVAAEDGTIARLEPATGRPVWKIKAGVSLTAGVGSDGATVVVAGEKGVLLAYDVNGKQLWKAQASSEILSAPAVGQGVVVVRSVDNRIAAFDAASGSRRWIVQRPVPPLTLRAAPGIAISGSTAFVALPGGRLAALALSNGGPQWEVTVGDPRGTTELERVADVSGMPVVSGRDVCAVAYQGRVACFDIAAGQARWAKEFSSNVGLGVDGRFVFAADEHGTVNAFDRDTGTGIWRNNKLANRGLSTPVSLGRAVVIGDAEGYVHFLSRDDGSLLARAATDGSPILPESIVATGANVILQTKAGTVTALTAE